MQLIENQRLRKFFFYSRGALQHTLLPDFYYRKQLEQKLTKIDQKDVLTRVAYYNKLTTKVELPEEACRLSDLSPWNKSTYFYDFRQLMRHFPASMKTAQRFGDVRTVSDFPRIVKTRPILKPNENSILLKLNSIRHYRPITDVIPYSEKKDRLVWRGKVKRDHRQTIFQKHFDNPLCDIGKTNLLKENDMTEWNKPFMSIQDQLHHKIILSIEGNEVATNLKWIAQSNSLCFMTRPKFESWFMEGTLKNGEHFVELKDDYSDLPEKLDHYLSHPDEAEKIIANFKTYYDRFRDPVQEELIGLLVIRKYLELTGQLTL